MNRKKINKVTNCRSKLFRWGLQKALKNRDFTIEVDSKYLLVENLM